MPFWFLGNELWLFLLEKCEEKKTQIFLQWKMIGNIFEKSHKLNAQNEIAPTNYIVTLSYANDQRI